MASEEFTDARAQPDRRRAPAASDGAEFERRNPADTRQRGVDCSGEHRGRRACAQSTRQPRRPHAWRRTTPSRRAELLTGAARLLAERSESIAAEMVAEEGKPMADAKNESSRTPRNLELYAGEAYRLTGATFPSDDTPLVYSVCDPVGVVGVITPWNFPLNSGESQDRSSTGRREHGCVQTVSNDTVDGRAAGRRIH